MFTTAARTVRPAVNHLREFGTRNVEYVAVVSSDDECDGDISATVIVRGEKVSVSRTGGEWSAALRASSSRSRIEARKCMTMAIAAARRAL